MGSSTYRFGSLRADGAVNASTGGDSNALADTAESELAIGISLEVVDLYRRDRRPCAL
jgi:hypothetical protein